MIRHTARAIHAEALKLRRTLALRMVFVAPVLVALLALSLQSAAVARGRGNLASAMWTSLTGGAITVWAVFILPFLITLETTLLSNVEHGERQWKHLFALPLPRYAIYLAKFLLVQILVLLSSLLLSVLLVLCGWVLMRWHPVLATAGPPPVWSILSRCLQCWLAAGFILSANFWIALRWPGFVVPLGTGIAGTFFALFATSADAGKYYPWLLPLNVLTTTDRAPVAFVLGIAGGVVLAVLGCIDFVRREESAPPKLSRLALSTWVLVALGFVAFAVYSDRRSLTGPSVPHTTRLIPVDQDVRLEVIDWGGSGRPLILLSGLGDTAHVFHKFASKLTPSYHVYGITRRGFGASSAPAAGYSARRLGDDVLAVIDSLRIQRPVLVGHSIGGEELSSIASRHPEKVAGLVYLDAAYGYAFYDSSRGDFSIDLFQVTSKLDQLKPGNGPRDPRPLVAELLSSLPGFERVLRERLKDLDAMAASNAPDPGSISSAASASASDPSRKAAQAIMAGQEKHTAIAAPILAIYALPHNAGTGGSAFAARDVAAITGPQAKALETAFPHARVVRLPNATHYVFQSNESDVLREIRSFTAALPPP